MQALLFNYIRTIDSDGRHVIMEQNTDEIKEVIMFICWLFLACNFYQSGTFSIIAIDRESDEFGIAVASRVLDVGYIVPWIEAGVGGVATQAFSNPHYGPWALELLRQGKSVTEVLTTILNRDSIPERRQVGIVDSEGNAIAHTGSETIEWAGHRIDSGVAVQGNILAGPEVVDSMLAAFVTSEGVLAERLLLALEAGERVGGDKRGKQSAALYVMRKRGGYLGVDDRLVELKVLDNEEPITELRRLYSLWQYMFLAQAYLRLADEEPDYESVFLERTYMLLLTALQSELDNADIYNNLAWAFALRKLYPKKTLEAALRAQSLDPEAVHIMDTLAEAYFATGDYDNAVFWEQKALHEEPENTFFQQQMEKFKDAQLKERR